MNNVHAIYRKICVIHSLFEYWDQLSWQNTVSHVYQYNCALWIFEYSSTSLPVNSINLQDFHLRAVIDDRTPPGLVVSHQERLSLGTLVLCSLFWHFHSHFQSNHIHEWHVKEGRDIQRVPRSVSSDRKYALPRKIWHLLASLPHSTSPRSVKPSGCTLTSLPRYSQRLRIERVTVPDSNPISPYRTYSTPS